MKTRMFVRAALAIGLMIASLTLTAAAAKPVTYSFQFAYSFTDDEVCEFPIVLSTDATAKAWDYVDDQGDLIRAKVKVTDVSAATNPANGRSVSGKNSWVDIVDVATGEQAVHGRSNMLTVPGAGVVVHDAGTVRIGPGPDYEVIFAAGKHEGYWEGDTEALCAALA